MFISAFKIILSSKGKFWRQTSSTNSLGKRFPNPKLPPHSGGVWWRKHTAMRGDWQRSPVGIPPCWGDISHLCQGTDPSFPPSRHSEHPPTVGGTMQSPQSQSKNCSPSLAGLRHLKAVFVTEKPLNKFVLLYYPEGNGSNRSWVLPERISKCILDSKIFNLKLFRQQNVWNRSIRVGSF